MLLKWEDGGLKFEDVSREKRRGILYESHVVMWIAMEKKELHDRTSSGRQRWVGLALHWWMELEMVLKMGDDQDATAWL